MVQDDTKACQLIHAFRQLRHVQWFGTRPMEGYTKGEAMLMFAIKRSMENGAEGLKASELSQRMRISSPSVTQMVNVLEARGYVERRQDPSDRRVVRLRLTELGKLETQKFETSMLEGLCGLIDRLGEERSDLLIELLQETYRYYSELADDTKTGRDDRCDSNTAFS